jgi:hypothetical protein
MKSTRIFPLAAGGPVISVIAVSTSAFDYPVFKASRHSQRKRWTARR